MTSHYELLGIDPKADESAIKRAWAKLVRQYPPDKDPDMNRKLNEAKGVLLDPTARADYEAQTMFGGELEALMQEGFEAMEDEEWEEAIVHYKLALALHPGSLAARNFLGLCYCYLEEYADAEKQLLRLTKDAPDSALYLGNLGHVYVNWSEEDLTKFAKAEQCFKTAVELEPFNASHHLNLARAFIRQKKYSEAEAAIEDAVGADGKVDIEDIEALMELTWVYLFSKQQHRISSVAERIAGFLPDDPEAREYASFKFLRTAAELADEYQAYKDSLVFVLAAKKIQNHFGEAHEAVVQLERNARADGEADRMRGEADIKPAVVPMIIAALTHRRLGFELPDSYFDELMQALVSWSNSEIRNAISRCKSKYPNACAVSSDLVDHMRELGTINSSAPQTSQAGTGCVIPCAILMLSLLVSVAASL